MLPLIWTQSYWRDEAFTIFQAGANFGQMFKDILWDSSPPFYYFLLHFWIRLFGDGEIATRSLSLIFHLLTVTLVFLILKLLTKNKFVSWLGAAVVLLNPFLVGYAFETRPYALLTFCLTAAVWSDLKRRTWITGVMLGLMILTHNFGLLFAISFGLFLVYKRLAIKPLVVPLIVWIMWLPVFWRQLTRVEQLTWIQPLGWMFLTVTIQRFFSGYSQIQILDLAGQLALILMVIAWAGQKNQKTALTGWLWLGPILLAAGFSKIVSPIYNERYLIAAVPMLIIWIAQGLYRQKNLIIKILICGYLAINGWGVWQLINKETKPGIRAAVLEIKQKIQPGEVILAGSEYNYLEVKYYSQKYLPGVPVWVKYPKEKSELPYYFGWLFYQEAVFVKTAPEQPKAWVIVDSQNN